jgi:hypothetical protein
MPTWSSTVAGPAQCLAHSRMRDASTLLPKGTDHFFSGRGPAGVRHGGVSRARRGHRVGACDRGAALRSTRPSLVPCAARATRSRSPKRWPSCSAGSVAVSPSAQKRLVDAAAGDGAPDARCPGEGALRLVPRGIDIDRLGAVVPFVVVERIWADLRAPEPLCYGGSGPGVRWFGRSHNPKVAGSNPAPAIRKPCKRGGFLLVQDFPGSVRGCQFERANGTTGPPRGRNSA